MMKTLWALQPSGTVADRKWRIVELVARAKTLPNLKVRWERVICNLAGAVYPFKMCWGNIDWQYKKINSIKDLFDTEYHKCTSYEKEKLAL